MTNYMSQFSSLFFQSCTRHDNRLRSLYVPCHFQSTVQGKRIKILGHPLNFTKACCAALVQAFERLKRIWRKTRLPLLQSQTGSDIIDKCLRPPDTTPVLGCISSFSSALRRRGRSTSRVMSASPHHKRLRNSSKTSRNFDSHGTPLK